MRTLRFAIALFCCFLLSGCVPLIIGGVGVLGGYAISKDTIAAETEKKAEDIWQASKDVVSIMGIVKNIDEDAKILEANVYGSSVVVRIERLTDVTNRLRVKARKLLMPNIGLAQKIFVKIMQKLD
ncbi:MAG: hypothetical protein AB1629_08045 [Candidatus Omnitrophota bacterium]